MYKKRNCGYCGSEFQPTTSRNKHCSVECRFRDIYSRITPANKSGCLEWPLSRQPFGYGQMAIGKDTPLTAHRLAWMYLRGHIPNGLHVLHHCDNPPCCNPDHLFLGTDADNNTDMRKKGRQAKNRLFYRGERHANAKLTNAQADAIRKSGEPYDKLAAKYRVSRGTIENIKRGITYL